MSIIRIVIVGSAIAAAALCGVAFSKEPLSKRQFTDMAVRYLQKHHLGCKVKVIADLHLECRDTSGMVAPVGLENAYLDYLDSIIARYLTPPPPYGNTILETEIESILPVVRTWAYYRDLSKQVANSPQSALTADSLNSELVIMYVRDMPIHIAFVTKQARNALDPTNVFFREIALSNLRKRFPEATLYPQKGFVMVTIDGSYESSLLLLDEYCDPVFYGWTGRLVVALPARDLFLVTRESDTGAIAELRRIAGMSDSMSHKISDKLFVRDSGVWKVFAPAN